MLFELNENLIAIQRLLCHKDVKTTIGIYNSFNSDYLKEAKDKLNKKIIKNKRKRKKKTNRKRF